MILSPASSAVLFSFTRTRSNSGTDSEQQAENFRTENNSAMCWKALTGSPIERIKLPGTIPKPWPLPVHVQVAVYKVMDVAWLANGYSIH
jgi:hypothetical protein